ncbi:hypothetical protein [Clostridium botulinum]|uniref:hypothetical protein n=1 Tax=Clostridium botulinum TaxID=1491 RepID=UPI0004BA5BBF|nr:hypothetical protein [Clostridium botulinum]QDY27046.1 hypothetical protein CGQ40_20290 [Clostridium botulinum]
MFENLKTNNVGKKLIKLSNYITSLKNHYDMNIINIIINCHIAKREYQKYSFENVYEITLNNITYIFSENNRIAIFVKDISIAKGAIDCMGQFYMDWNHNIPKEMIKQIKEDSKIIGTYIKDIKQYIKNNKTIKQIRHDKEQEQLQDIFCK